MIIDLCRSYSQVDNNIISIYQSPNLSCHVQKATPTSQRSWTRQAWQTKQKTDHSQRQYNCHWPCFVAVTFVCNCPGVSSDKKNYNKSITSASNSNPYPKLSLLCTKLTRRDSQPTQKSRYRRRILSKMKCQWIWIWGTPRQVSTQSEQRRRMNPIIDCIYMQDGRINHKDVMSIATHM